MQQPKRILVWLDGAACSMEQVIEGVRLALALCAAGHAVELVCAGGAVQTLGGAGSARLAEYLTALRREADTLWVVQEDVIAQGLSHGQPIEGFGLLARADIPARLRACDISIPF